MACSRASEACAERPGGPAGALEGVSSGGAAPSAEASSRRRLRAALLFSPRCRPATAASCCAVGAEGGEEAAAAGAGAGGRGGGGAIRGTSAGRLANSHVYVMVVAVGLEASLAQQDQADLARVPNEPVRSGSFPSSAIPTPQRSADRPTRSVAKQLEILAIAVLHKVSTHRVIRRVNARMATVAPSSRPCSACWQSPTVSYRFHRQLIESNCQL